VALQWLCWYPIPEPPPGEQLDLSQVALFYYAGGNYDEPEVIDQSVSTESCWVGWTFDDPVNPTGVQLCLDTCARVNADPGAAVSVHFDCWSTD